MAAKKTTTKKTTGDTNADPITGEPGAHPVGVGVGTAGGSLGGAAAGAAIGTAVAGPVGTAVGAVIGAVTGGVAGGLAGKEVSEQIDPTAEDAYWREHYAEREYVAEGREYDHYAPAYGLGVKAATESKGKSFEEVEGKLKRGWTKARGESELGWTEARDAARDAYDRVIRLREEQLNVKKDSVEAGEVSLRKEVVTETQTVEVPVEREEVVIERKKVNRVKSGAMEAESATEVVRVPVREERVRVEKDTVTTEEVGLKKKKVTDTKKVTGTVRKEKLKVDDAAAKSTTVATEPE